MGVIVKRCAKSVYMLVSFCRFCVSVLCAPLCLRASMSSGFVVMPTFSCGNYSLAVFWLAAGTSAI